MSPYLGVSLVFWLSVTTFKSRDLSRDPTKVALMRDLLKKKNIQVRDVSNSVLLSHFPLLVQSMYSLVMTPEDKGVQELLES